MFTSIVIALAMRSAVDALASSAPPNSQPSSQKCTPLAPPSGKSGVGVSSSASVRDEETKLMVLSSPKAGATLAMRLMLARLNLTAAAQRYPQYPLHYTHAEFNRMQGRTPPRRVEDLRPCSSGGGWLCIEIVRNPLDRAISSYLMTLRTPIHLSFAELGDACGPGVPAAACKSNASFAEFARALAARALTRTRSEADDHFMPQAALTKHNRGRFPGVVRVPIEMMSETDGAECAPLAPLQPWRLPEAEARVFGVRVSTGHHYVVKEKGTSGNSEHLPFAVLAAASAMPAYDSFWTNQTFCRKVVGCLYRADVALYVGACTDATSPLRGCAAYERVCARELARLRGVCGLDLDEH